MLSLCVVLIGDTGCGKTSLSLANLKNSPPGEYIPTVMDNVALNVMVDGKPCQTKIWDTYAENPVAPYRTDAYSCADAIIIFFDLNNRETFDNVKIKWHPEIDLHCPDVPFILVGNKRAKRDEFMKEYETNHDFVDNDTANMIVHGFVRQYDNGFVPDTVIGICFNYYFVSAPVSKQEGMEMSKVIGAKKYMEHALHAMECKAVLNTAISEAIKYHEKQRNLKKKGRCSIL